MSEESAFFNVRPVDDALRALFEHWQPSIQAESADPRRALGRILAAAPKSPVHLPEFDRSTMDGYAVRAADTFGASAALPAYLKCVGSVRMGARPDFTISAGQSAQIHTGGMLPDGADAVVMIERTQQISDDEVEILTPVAPGENIVHFGEDVTAGKEILPAGHQIRPQDIAGLLGVGIREVQVVRPPRIAILSTGDELVHPEETPDIGQIRDINASMIAALAAQAGAEPLPLGISPDVVDQMLAKAKDGLKASDMLIITAGSSVSARDMTGQVINALGKPGILQHGLAVKPGKPTILAVCAGKPVVGLPGNPASAFLVAQQVVLPIIRRMLGQAPAPTPVVRAVLQSSLPSTTGREDSIPVRLRESDGQWAAYPVFGKSNLIYTLVNADGLVRIPLNSGGLYAGSIVEVQLI